jgi:hypothetical protein
MRDKKLMERIPRLLKDLNIEQREYVDDDGEVWLLVSPEDIEFLHGGTDWA